MKCIYSLLFIFIYSIGKAQSDHATTIRTKVVDLILKYPATTSEDLNKLNQELYPIAPDAVRVMIENLHNFGVANDAQLKYALNGLVAYLSKDPQNSIVNETANVLIKSLASGLSADNKNFVFEQLMLIANEQHLPSLSGFLFMDEFVDACSRLFTRLGGKTANDILISSYAIANKFQKYHITKAISSIGEERGLDYLLEEFQDLEHDMQNVVLQNFAQKGYARSENLLKSLAEQENYSGNYNSKTHFYLQLLTNLLNSNTNNTEYQNKLTSFAERDNINTHLRLLALQSLFSKDQKQTIPLLLKNVQSPDRTLRQTVISMLSGSNGDEVGGYLYKSLEKSKDLTIQEDLLYFFGKNKFPSGIKLFSKLLKSSDQFLKVAALKALLQNNPEEAYERMIPLLKTGNAYLASEIKSLFLRSDKAIFDKVFARNYSKLNESGKLVALDLLGKRKSTALSQLIFSDAKSSKAKLRDKAIEELKNVVKATDYPILLDLLRKRNEKSNIVYLQEAIWNSLLEVEESRKRTLINVSSIVKMGQLYKFYNLYSKLGSNEDLNLVVKDLQKNPVNAEYALEAFSSWKDGLALDHIFAMAIKSTDLPLKENAILSYISQIVRNKYQDDQKLLLLRKIEPELKDNKVQIPYIRALGQINTIQSLSNLDKYLDNDKTRQSAINAIFNIIQNSNIYGKLAREIVEKAIKLNLNTDALYIQEAVIKKMGTWPSDMGFVPIFNGKDLTGWKGLVGNPLSRAKMSKEEDFELVLDWKTEVKSDGGI